MADTAKQIIVLGAGVVGVTTAYKLAIDGHNVTVIDAEDGAAMMTSFANAGLVTPGHSSTWASPKAPLMLLKSLWRKDAGIRIKLQPSWRQWKWMLQFLGQCTSTKHQKNSIAMTDLCRFSQLHLNAITRQSGVKYDGKTSGLMYLHRSKAALDADSNGAQHLRDQGMAAAAINTEEMVRLDPGLATIAPQCAGALYVPTDESGDAHLFTRALADAARKVGVKFHYNTRIQRLITKENKVVRVQSDKGDFTADDFVLCLGVRSPDLVRRLGIDLPIYPARGYSLTVPITDRQAAPRMGGLDSENMVAYCPMGDRLRLTTGAEIRGFDRDYTAADFKPLLDKARRMFGHCADFSDPKYWVGLRPMTPSGRPIIDKSPIDNLWLNVGHGYLGWTMSCGSAAIISDIIAGRTPNHNIDDFTYANR
jgi:D-amino-acid dehydrogenase